MLILLGLLEELAYPLYAHDIWRCFVLALGHTGIGWSFAMGHEHNLSMEVFLLLCGCLTVMLSGQGR